MGVKYFTKQNHIGVTELLSTLNATVTTHVFSFTAVGTHKMQRITNVSASNSDSNFTWAIYKNDGGTGYAVYNQYTAINAARVDNWHGEIILEATDYIQVFINGTVANDDVSAIIMGEEWFV